MAGETGHVTEKQHGVSTEGISVMEGEHVLQNRHPGWVLWWKALAVAVLIFLFTLGSGEAGTIFGGLIIAAGIVGYVAFARARSRYIVTDERIKMSIGFIRNDSREFRISDLQGIDVSQSILARIFGVGDLQVRTADGAGITWRAVPDADDVARTIREHQRQYDATMDRKDATVSA